MGKVVFVFTDGLGLAPAGEHNPLARAPMPFVRSLLGGPLTLESVQEREGLLLKALDATLGVEGIPQSATGQVSLFTGVNAAALEGRHVHVGLPQRLVELVRERSILKRAVEAGFRATFANAYTPLYEKLVREGKRRHFVTTWAAIGAGIPRRTLEDLAAGRAVYWDITHEILTGHLGFTEIPVITPRRAGHTLARLASEYDLVLFETFLPDVAGHRRIEPEKALSVLDGFLEGLLEGDPPFTLVLSSDHGNVEDDSTRLHTRNPVPLLVVGPAARLFHRCESITDVAEPVLQALKT